MEPKNVQPPQGHMALPVSPDHMYKFLGELYYRTKMYEEIIVSQSNEIRGIKTELDAIKKAESDQSKDDEQ